MLGFPKRKDIQIEVFLGAHNVCSMYNSVIFASLFCWLCRLFAVVFDQINKNVKCVLYLCFPILDFPSVSGFPCFVTHKIKRDSLNSRLPLAPSTSS